MKTQIWYHKNCLDGIGAALAAYQYFADYAEYIPMYYGDDWPELEGVDDIFMVDFSVKFDDMINLARRVKSITVIDHHKTAKDDLMRDDLPENVKVIFDMGYSGAVLAWRYFMESSDEPELFQHIEDRDLWRFELPGTKNICAALQLYPEWTNWSLDRQWCTDLVIEGDAINRFIAIQGDKIIANEPTLWEMTGDIVPVYNILGFMISDTLHRALEVYPDAPYAVAYFDLPGKRIYSLRSTDNRQDVSEIAKRFGGGGHRNAAGFTVCA